MKSAHLTALAALLLAGRSHAALGTISTSISPSGTLSLSDTFTVSLSISGYTEATQIDAYQFRITYPSALFAFVGPIDPGSSAVGPNQQWLSMSSQESAASGYSLLASDDGSVAGTISIDHLDIGFSVVEGGTNTASGFLVSFTMQAIATGTGSFAPSAPASGVTFFDVDFANAGSPAFSGASVTVVPEPSGLAALGAAALGLRRRRKC